MRRLRMLDWIALGLLAAGGGCVATGLLPVLDAEATVRRILPLLLFLATVVMLAELTALAEVFDVIAARLAITARGRFVALFALCVAFAALTTITLNLDTTAVLLTPVMLALAGTLRISPLPLAMTTVWLANTASLLLPVSNLTNLLAADRIRLAPPAFAARMWLPQLAAVATTMLFLWIWYWRKNARGGDERFTPPTPHRPRDRVLFRVAALACLLFVAAVLAGLPLGLASGAAAGVLVVAFALRDRSALRAHLLPWRLLVFVTGLFLVMQTIGRHGLDEVAGALIGSDPGAAGALRAGATGVGLANLVNNLPAYVAGESVVPAGHPAQLLALLIGVNLGPLAVPWASLATLLWFERCTAAGVRAPLVRFVATGAGLALVGTAASVGGLLLTS